MIGNMVGISIKEGILMKYNYVKDIWKVTIVFASVVIVFTIMGLM